MAGPEGFDPSLIETEALLKKMKPRPANLSAARIVYEAGRAVGKEEIQTQLAGGGFVMASAPLAASTWKKWILPSWAGGATVLCFFLWFQFSTRIPQAPEPQSNFAYPTNYPNPQSQAPFTEELHRSQGYGGVPASQLAEQPAPQPQSMPAEKLISPGSNLQRAASTAASDSENQSGTPRTGRDLGPPKQREKNLAEYIREQFPILESRRNIDPIEIRDGVLQPPQSGMALTTLGMIKMP